MRKSSSNSNKKRKKIQIAKPSFMTIKKGLQMEFRFIPFTTKIKDVEYVEIEDVPSGDLYLTSAAAFREVFEYLRKMGVDFSQKTFYFEVNGKESVEGGGSRWDIDFFELE